MSDFADKLDQERRRIFGFGSKETEDADEVEVYGYVAHAFREGASAALRLVAEEYAAFREKHGSYIVGQTIGPLYDAGYNDASASTASMLKQRAAEIDGEAKSG